MITRKEAREKILAFFPNKTVFIQVKDAYFHHDFSEPVEEITFHVSIVPGIFPGDLCSAAESKISLEDAVEKLVDQKPQDLPDELDVVYFSTPPEYYPSILSLEDAVLSRDRSFLDEETD